MNELSALQAIASIVEDVSGFSATNVSLADWAALSSGRSDHYAIVVPSEATRTASALDAKVNIYSASVDIWQRQSSGAIASLITHCESVQSALDAKRTLGLSNVRDANVVGMSAVFEAEYGGSVWLRRSVRVEWTEEEVMTYE